jgi:hypothetical protein
MPNTLLQINADTVCNTENVNLLPFLEGIKVWLIYKEKRQCGELYIVRSNIFKDIFCTYIMPIYVVFWSKYGTREKKVTDFPVPSRDVTYQTLPVRE